MASIIKNTELIFTSQIQGDAFQFSNADGTTPKIILTASQYTTLVSSITISSNAANRVLVNIGFRNDDEDSPNFGVVARLAQINVPAGAAYNGIDAAVNGMNDAEMTGIPVDNAGNKVLNLPYMRNLVASIDILTPLGAGESIFIAALGANYEPMTLQSVNSMPPIEEETI